MEDLFVEYIINLLKHLKTRDIETVYVYFDMWFKRFNLVNEETAQRFKDAGVFDMLVLDWWSYDPANRNFGRHDENGNFHKLF